MFPDTLLFTLRDSFTDCIETFFCDTNSFRHNISHVVRVFVHDIVDILYHDREYNSGHGTDKRDFKLSLTIDICRRQLHIFQKNIGT